MLFSWAYSSPPGVTKAGNESHHMWLREKAPSAQPLKGHLIPKNFGIAKAMP